MAVTLIGCWKILLGHPYSARILLGTRKDFRIDILKTNYILIMRSKIVMHFTFNVSGVKLLNNHINHKVFSIWFFILFKIFLTTVLHIISAADFTLILLKFCSKMPYFASRMLASKIAFFARNSAGRIYPSLEEVVWWSIR